jgi:hypothetical protein
LVRIPQAYRSDPDPKSATGNKKKLKSKAACIARTYADKSHVEKLKKTHSIYVIHAIPTLEANRWSKAT